MIMLSLSNCPHALRGDLSRWLFEVDTNLYVGKLSARVRDMIWERVITHIRAGRAVMVFPTNNEQGFDFRIWGSTWEPTDYDGLKLMLRPHPNNTQANEKALLPGNSKVEKRLAAKRFPHRKRGLPPLPDTYLVIDVETTGLSADKDELIEIGAIKVIDGESAEIFQALVRTKTMIPSPIERLTGITNDDIAKDGQRLADAVEKFRKFAVNLPIVSHNVSFDMSFLRKAYLECGYPMPTNVCIDTLRMARQFIQDSPNYKLETLLTRFDYKQTLPHRAIGDCEATKFVFERLRIIVSDSMETEVNENDQDE